MRGIVLAGGTGSRLWPVTQAISKQLLPVYDKPMIYYPISTLMLAGVREILIITTPEDQGQFKKLLGDGSQLGMKFSFEIQLKPKGLAQALLIAENFLSQEPCLMILGDNLFHGNGLGGQLASSGSTSSCEIFTCEVVDPYNYGVAEIDKNSKLVSIEEKPKKPKSNFAVTGLYYFDERAPRFAAEISPSTRGELEITSVIQKYLNEGSVLVNKLSRGTAWLDTGNINSLHDASSYIRVLEERTGLKIGCIEEIAFKNSWIDKTRLSELALSFKGNSYGAYLTQILTEDKNNGG
jgi:glucose-1-phosphate thymidylyltransferase